MLGSDWRGVGRRNKRVVAGLIAAIAFAVPSVARGQSLTCSTAIVSNRPDGGWANGPSSVGALTPDGSIVAFASSAGNLIVPDIGLSTDAYWLDRNSGTLRRVSVSSTGQQGNDSTYPFSLSFDGNLVLMGSFASNLVPGDTNARADAFIYDVRTGTTERVSLTSGGGEIPDGCAGMSMSADGRFVAFDSESFTVVPGDTNGATDVFLRDRLLGITTRISVGPGGVEGDFGSVETAISADGRFIAYVTFASNIVVPDATAGADLVVYDRLTDTTRRASQTAAGVQAEGAISNPSISADGRFVAFDTTANNVFPSAQGLKVARWDSVTGALELVSRTSSGVAGNGASDWPSISGDGRFIAFESTSTNLVPGSNGEWNILVRDMLTGEITRASQNDAGQAANSQSLRPRISADGTHVYFYSRADNLIPATPSLMNRSYVRDCTPNSPLRYCVGKRTSQGCTPVISSTGTPSASAGTGFVVKASNMVSARPGVLIYATTSSAQLPFQGSFLCMAPPLRYIGAQTTRGTPTFCSGTMSVDFNAWIATGNDPTLIQGQAVFAQYLHRDPGLRLPFRLGMSDALMFHVGP